MRAGQTAGPPLCWPPGPWRPCTDPCIFSPGADAAPHDAAMLWLSQTHPASATVAAVRLDRWYPDGPCLCVAQQSALAFYTLAEHSTDAEGVQQAQRPLSLLERVPLRARILALEAIRTDGAPDRVVVLTDHPVPRLIALRPTSASDVYDLAQPRPWPHIHTETSLVLHDAARPPAELGLGLYMEPSNAALRGRWAATHTHTGQLRVVPLDGFEAPVQTSHAFNARYVVC